MGRVFYSRITESDIENIVSELKDKSSYRCIIPYSDRTTEVLISRVLLTLLTNVFQSRLHQNIEFIVNELVMNACKANVKRVYFNRSELDINKVDDYNKGIKGFFSEVYSSFPEYIPELKEKQYYIKIEFFINGTSLNINIQNNSTLLNQEIELINKSIKSAHKFESLNEIFTNSFKSFEGSGYGLILVVLMLRKLNTPSRALTISSEEGITTTSLKIPMDLINTDQGSLIADEIVKEIDELPLFPESILKLQKELNDPECNFPSITNYIISDPPLSAEVLRIANSPVYISKERIDKVSEAVTRIGIKGLNSILYSYGATKVLEKRYKMEVINSINEHLFSVALISSYLASYRKLDDFAEDIFVAALLHDIGKIIVNSLDLELTEKISKLCLDKSIPSSIIDKLSNGYNHTIIGAELTKKWNFPVKYVNAIRYHHNPTIDEGYYKAITYCVYMGNEIHHYLNSGRKLSFIDSTILDFFNLNSRENFDKFIMSMKNEGLDL